MATASGFCWLKCFQLEPISTCVGAARSRLAGKPAGTIRAPASSDGSAIGLLVNGRQIRLVYAPEKELSGHITFNLADMVKVAGRPIFAALQMLLGAERLYSVAEKERLPAILANSRKYQNVVSTQLATQVLEALYELLRGFQAANDQSKGELLRDVLARDPDHVYHGLLTTLLRLVFVLYRRGPWPAFDRSNLFELLLDHGTLRAAARGCWPVSGHHGSAVRRLGATARALPTDLSGGSHGAMKIPAREGYLFDPDRYLFLEGRHDKKDKPAIPRVSDGVAVSCAVEAHAAGWRAAELSNTGGRTDRQRLRSHHGLRACRLRRASRLRSSQRRSTARPQPSIWRSCCNTAPTSG